MRITPNGRCRRCNGEHWTVSVLYSETGSDNADLASAGIMFGARHASGAGWLAANLFSAADDRQNQSNWPNVPAATIAQFEELPRQRLSRVSLFAREKARESLKQQGGLECRACESLFVPVAGQPWGEKGYCSKLCFVEEEGESGLAQL